MTSRLLYSNHCLKPAFPSPPALRSASNLQSASELHPLPALSAPGRFLSPLIFFSSGSPAVGFSFSSILLLLFLFRIIQTVVTNPSNTIHASILPPHSSPTMPIKSSMIEEVVPDVDAWEYFMESPRNYPDDQSTLPLSPLLTILAAQLTKSSLPNSPLPRRRNRPLLHLCANQIPRRRLRQRSQAQAQMAKGRRHGPLHAQPH